MKPSQQPLIVNSAALDAFADGFRAMGAAIVESLAPIADAMRTYAPPPAKNLPHDPSLRKDRRKWGGR